MMKKYIGLFLLVLWSTSGLMAQEYHYYYQGNQVPLDLNTEHAYLLLEGVQSAADLKALIGDAEVVGFDVYQVSGTLAKVPGARAQAKGQSWAEIRFPGKLTESSYLQQLKTLERTSGIQVASPFFDQGRQLFGLSDLFRVKLAALGDPQQLMTMAATHGVEVVGRNRFMPEWYTLAVTPGTGANALEMANVFHESGKFATAEPDLMGIEAHCVNDPLFADQWGHNNTGQQGTGPDIRACAGWGNWGRGDEFTIIAVLDHGIQLDHPDLQANLVQASFDTETGTSPSAVLGSHGTACAGIAAARDNNNLGISGVAPDCSLMSLSNELVLSPNISQNLADGFNWAVQNGADVISNSWGNVPQSQILEDAIANALNNGRGGLGTVVVFSTGNDDGAVGYPGNTFDDILAVGAMSPCGERKNPNSCDGENWWGSNYGPELDVMAPGVLIPTTDRTGADGYDPGNFTMDFNGTSSACPHVAGLAGLLISLNPCLSQRQVGRVIEQTAQKVGGYGYTTTSGRPNGTWDDEMGYGLIDINAAMALVQEMYIQNTTFTGTELQQIGGDLFVGSNVDPSQTQGPVQVNANADLALRAGDHIFLENSFHTVDGAEFSALPIANDCNLWNQNARLMAPVETETSVEEVMPAGFALPLEMSISPNPFHDRLILRYNLENESRVHCVLFNAQGQQVMQMLDGRDQASGNHEKTVYLPERLPAGIYFVRMEIDGKGMTKKLLKNK